jgi:hypothetical protein
MDINIEKKECNCAAVFRVIINTVVVQLPDPDKGRNPAVASHLLLLALSGTAKSQENNSDTHQQL